jgi:hypothetical protein
VLDTKTQTKLGGMQQTNEKNEHFSRDFIGLRLTQKRKTCFAVDGFMSGNTL